MGIWQGDILREIPVDENLWSHMIFLALQSTCWCNTEKSYKQQKYGLLPHNTHLALQPTAQGRSHLGVMSVCLVALGIFAFSEFV